MPRAPFPNIEHIYDYVRRVQNEGGDITEHGPNVDDYRNAYGEEDED